MTADYIERISPDGELKWSTRMQLHEALRVLKGTDGLRSYLRLSAACAVRAWPVWLERFDDDLPYASPVQGATPEQPELALTSDPIELGRLATFLDNRMRLGSDTFPAVAAGLSCWAVDRDSFRGAPVEPSGDDELDVDSEDWEASYFASIAVAGGAIWEAGADSARRRAFWVWYLQEAVPASYDA
ncbi:Imm5 family immunity protein [Dactylosporangium sp. CS-047395]|uniref:Imm5 family immunity protein n=1 Tax=Dactylosporangium sp. CS-047395 TaxID=3239936 RepID=UPI003D8D158F